MGVFIFDKICVFIVMVVLRIWLVVLCWWSRDFLEVFDSLFFGILGVGNYYLFFCCCIECCEFLFFLEIVILWFMY